MRPGILACAAALWCAAAMPAEAQTGPQTSAFGQCLVRASSAADRTALLRWMFVAVAAHPGVGDLVSITDARRQEVTRDAGRLFNRLITRDCRREAIAALRADGDKAMETAFQTLGESTTEALMNSPAGAAVVESILSHLDVEAVARMLEEAAAPATPST